MRFRNCQRCGQQTISMITSMFNTQDICMKCKDREKAHPKYKEACDAEHEAIKNGDYNFRGIGLPADLLEDK